MATPPVDFDCPRCGGGTRYNETDQGGQGIRCESVCTRWWCRKVHIWWWRGPLAYVELDKWGQPVDRQ